MALPLPRVIPDVGPGGGLVTAMGGMNSLANDMLLKKINQIKAQYMPLTTQAEAASKLAYANLMGPQFLAKLLGNPAVIANMGDDAAKSAVLNAVGAGMGRGGANLLGQLQQGSIPSPQSGQNSLMDVVTNKLKGIFTGTSEAPRNPLSNAMPSDQGNQISPSNQLVQQETTGQPKSGDTVYGDVGDPAIDEAYIAWNQSPEGKRELSKGIKGHFPSEEEVLQWKRNRDSKMQMDRTREPSFAENTGLYKGTIKQREEEGKYRAEALKNMGESQLGLSNSGAALTRMANIVKSPTFQNMRSKFPFFQDKQLSYLMKKGTTEEKRIIGDFISTSENIIASGVQAFGGRPLVREFDLLKRQKVSEADPVHVAEGKLRSSIALHDVMEQKNRIITDLLKRGYNEADAVQVANKKVDVGVIEKATEDLLRDKPTDEDIDYMARKRNISPDEVRKQLRERGIL